MKLAIIAKIRELVQGSASPRAVSVICRYGTTV
jgi:hypothetical protein